MVVVVWVCVWGVGGLGGCRGPRPQRVRTRVTGYQCSTLDFKQQNALAACTLEQQKEIDKNTLTLVESCAAGPHQQLAPRHPPSQPAAVA